jgi:hypothetical protein
MKKLFVICAVALCVLPLPVSAQRFTREIKLGANGADVKALQQRLLSLGFSQIGPADGAYGPRTEKAIREIKNFLNFDYKYEKDKGSYAWSVHSIGCDGKVTKNLWDMLFDDDYADLLEIISFVSAYEYGAYRMRIQSESDGYDHATTRTTYWDGNVIRRIVVQNITEGMVSYRDYIFYDWERYFELYYSGSLTIEGDGGKGVYIYVPGGYYGLANGRFYETEGGRSQLR